MRRFNLFGDVREAKFGPSIGASKLAAGLFVLPPGEAVSAYHHEVVEEEWLLVLAGTPTVRTPGGEEVSGPGDVICFPRGPAGAHQVVNTASEPARVLLVSECAELSMAVYPDEDEVGLFRAGGGLSFRRSDAL